MKKVLEGITVLEQGTFITGPAAGMLLADLGATVIKIEQPGSGDPFRAFRGGLYSPHFQTYNRNKRSVTLNTKLPEDAAVFDELVNGADVYIQNFRPGAADRLGAGWERLHKLNPRLVYGAISGFGQTGPAAGRPAYDTVAQAASGYLNLLINPANPRVVGPALADAMTGFYAAYGIMGALVERGRTGVGRLVEVSMLEAMCHFNLDAFTHYFAEGEVMGPFSRPSVSQSYVLRCADGKWIALHMSSPEKFWQGLANAIERPEIFKDERFATREGRIQHQEDLIALLGGIFKSRPRSAWCERLEAEDVPHAPMYDTSEALEDPQARHLQLEIQGTHPEIGVWRTVRSPVSYDGERALEVTPPPLLGEANDAVLGPIRARLDCYPLTPMVRLAANLSMLFTELPFLERFEASRREGFDAVEFAYPNDTALDKILKALQGSRQQQVLGTLPAPAGDKGVAALVGAEDEFRRRFQLGIEAATAAACPLVHITTGVVPEADRAAASEVFERNLQWALRIAEQCGLRLAIEAVNPVDLPGYFIRSLDDARAWISRIASPNFGLLVDLYHARMEGRRIADVLGLIPAEAFHVQIAGAPGRAEPDKGDVDFGLAFDTLDSAGWSGWIGCEYRPATTTLEGLPWVDRLVPGFRRRTRHEVR